MDGDEKISISNQISKLDTHPGEELVAGVLVRN
jgi:hypothetical protein